MATQVDAHSKSEFQSYLDNNPQVTEQLMKIVVNLYCDPKKVSETQE
jgi:uncharacterized protein YneF (UPF0154 family)